MDSIEVVPGGDLPADEATPGVFRRVVFETADTIVVQSRVAGGVTTDWHHNVDRHVYGYVTVGRATLEHGPDGTNRVEMTAGDFVYVPPGTIRRIVNATDEDWVVVLSFVGSGPPAVNVDSPADASSLRGQPGTRR